MNFKKNLLCCASSPVCHFVALMVGCLTMIQLVHTHAHYTMDVDTDSYVRSFCKNNKDKCKTIMSELGS